MMPALASTSPWVWLRSGLRLSVQLTKVALRPVKSCSSVMCGSPVGVGSEKLGVLLHAEQGRSVGGEQLGHRGVELVAMGDTDPAGTAQLGVRRPVGVGERGVPDRVVGGELLL